MTAMNIVIVARIIVNVIHLVRVGGIQIQGLAIGIVMTTEMIKVNNVLFIFNVLGVWRFHPDTKTTEIAFVSVIKKSQNGLRLQSFANEDCNPFI